jgi:hypothetical protein
VARVAGRLKLALDRTSVAVTCSGTIGTMPVAVALQ